MRCRCIVRTGQGRVCCFRRCYCRYYCFRYFFAAVAAIAAAVDADTVAAATAAAACCQTEQDGTQYGGGVHYVFFHLGTPNLKKVVIQDVG